MVSSASSPCVVTCSGNESGRRRRALSARSRHANNEQSGDRDGVDANLPVGGVGVAEVSALLDARMPLAGARATRRLRRIEPSRAGRLIAPQRETETAGERERTPKRATINNPAPARRRHATPVARLPYGRAATRCHPPRHSDVLSTY
ncbi:jg15752 [Pararge aegeria aegeria]|uniref:Jg15752 protein n=1 Tax=Pararge aegeria aegeria TaxID=348720 RepID=A0A8S4RKB6_9NEOP|nr:jg15752 [Pararge aegeria aegeria]